MKIAINYKYVQPEKVRNDMSQAFENIIAPLNDFALNKVNEAYEIVKKEKFFRQTFKRDFMASKTALEENVDYAERRLAVSSGWMYKKFSKEEIEYRAELRKRIHDAYVAYFDDAIAMRVEKFREAIERNFVEHNYIQYAHLLSVISVAYNILELSKLLCDRFFAEAKSNCRKDFREVFAKQAPYTAFKKWSDITSLILNHVPSFDIDMRKQLDVRRSQEKMQRYIEHGDFIEECLAKAYNEYADELPEEYEVVRLWLNERVDEKVS